MGTVADAADAEGVPVEPSPGGEELVQARGVLEELCFGRCERFGGVHRIVLAKADRLSGCVELGRDGEGDGVEAAEAVAEEAADEAVAVVDEDLESVPGVRSAAEHDAGVGGPVRVQLEGEFEVAERLVADEVAAVPAPRGCCRPTMAPPSTVQAAGCSAACSA